jgi:hypothetical protein
MLSLLVKMEAVRFYETLVSHNITTQCNKPEDHYFNAIKLLIFRSIVTINVDKIGVFYSSVLGYW